MKVNSNNKKTKETTFPPGCEMSRVREMLIVSESPVRTAVCDENCNTSSLASGFDTMPLVHYAIFWAEM
jgi:hypothetical protein